MKRVKKPFNIEIGNNIRVARENSHLTQEQLSEFIDTGTNHLSAIECGTVGVTVAKVRKICEVLSISSDDILFGRIEPIPEAQYFADRLSRLSPEQFEIAKDILNKLFEAFAVGR